MNFSIKFFFVEEKEKLKDEFDKEVQMAINVDEQTAEERARLRRMKISKQGLVDNDTPAPVVKSVRKSIDYEILYFLFDIFKREQSLLEDKLNKTTDTSKQPIVDNTSKSVIPVVDKKSIENRGSDHRKPSSSSLPGKSPIIFLNNYPLNL